MVNPAAERNEVPVCGYLLGITWQVEDSLLFFLGEHGTAGQRIQEQLEVGRDRVSHNTLHLLQAGAHLISQPPKPAGSCSVIEWS